MKRTFTCLIFGLAATTLSMAQSIDEVSSNLMVKVLFSKNVGTRGLFHQVSDSSVSILAPFSLAKRSVRNGSLVSGVYFAEYKFSEITALQLKRKDPGGAMLRGVGAVALPVVAPLTLIAFATNTALPAFLAFTYGAPLAGFVGLVRGLSGNFVRIYDSRKVGDPSIDEEDLQRMDELISKYK